MAEGTRKWVLAAAAVIGAAAALWKLLCVWLRARRARFIASFSPVEDAYTLRKLTNNVEFPFLSHTSLQFALFRTYAIPSISRILAKTGNFEADAVKRAEDTEILLRELTFHHVDSDRGATAIRRLNHIHGQYKIKNEDYLYVLALFVLEPIRWVSRYGFRDFTTSEKIANFITWRDVGVRMGIKDIPEGIEELERWQIEYEKENMVYAESNRKIADTTVELLLQDLPKPTRPVFHYVVFAMLDDRLRVAFGYPEQPQWLQSLVRAMLKFVAGTCIAWFHPPRPLSFPVDRIPVNVNDQGVGFDPNKTLKLAFHRYGACTYPDGYKIPELGTGKPGLMGSAFEGELLCPLSDRYFQTPWPLHSNGSCGNQKIN